MSAGLVPHPCSGQRYWTSSRVSPSARRRGVQRSVTRALRFYRRHVSGLFGPRCRFYPTCSAYALDAVEKHGAARGMVLAGWRLLRCNQFSSGGVDDVPENFELHLHAYDRFAAQSGQPDSHTRLRGPKE